MYFFIWLITLTVCLYVPREHLVETVPSVGRGSSVYDYNSGEVYVPFSFKSILKYFNQRKQEPVDCEDSDDSTDEDCDSDDDWFFEDLNYDSDGYDTDYETYHIQNRGPLRNLLDKDRINRKPLVKSLKQLTNKTMEPFREMGSEMGVNFQDYKITKAWNKFYHLFAPFKHKLLKAMEKMTIEGEINDKKESKKPKGKKNRKVKIITDSLDIEVTKQDFTLSKVSQVNLTITNSSIPTYLNLTYANFSQLNFSHTPFTGFNNFTGFYEDSATSTPLHLLLLILMSSL